ncbi:MAG: MFS transporter, partial [Acidobacteriaceae bacterium]
PANTSPAASPPTAASEESALHRVWSDMEQGFSFIIHDAGLLFVIVALAAGMFVIGCFAPLTALYVRDTLHASTRTFGVVSALVGVGMVVGINVLSAFAKSVKNTALVYFGLAGIGVGLMILAALTHLWSAFLGEFVIGFAFAAIFVPSETMIQQETPPALLGRVGSTVMSIVFAAQIMGLVVSGILADYIGVREVFAICAILLAILIVVGRVWMRPNGKAAAAV